VNGRLKEGAEAVLANQATLNARVVRLHHFWACIYTLSANLFQIIPPYEKFTTELDAAEILGLSIHQLRRAPAKGGVPHARLTGWVVYLESALAEWQAAIYAANLRGNAA